MQTFMSSLSSPYPVYVGQSILETDFFDSSICAHTGPLVVITDAVVAPLYVRDMVERWRLTRDVHVIEVSGGERNKTRSRKDEIEDRMMQLGVGSDVLMIAIGGGVVLDMAAFVAATYVCGVPCVLIPTTLVSMVTLAISDRVRVHTPLGRNHVGVHTHPRSVWLDIDVLQSLSHDDLCDGMVYMLQLALLHDRDLFETLSLMAGKWTALDVEHCVKLLMRCLEIRSRLMLPEGGMRDALLFGVVMGQALLQSAHYNISEGQALHFGLLLESRLSSAMDLLSAHDLMAIKHCLASIKYQNNHLECGVTPDQLLMNLRVDPSCAAKSTSIVLLQKIASVYQPKGRLLHVLDADLLRDCVSGVFSNAPAFFMS